MKRFEENYGDEPMIIDGSDMSSKKGYEAGWNLSQFIIQDLSAYLHEGAMFYMKGHMESYFWSLELVKRRIYPFLNKAEIEQTDTLENEIKKIISVYSINLEGKKEDQKVLIVKAKNKCTGKLKEYDALIMSLLNHYGLFMKEAEDRTKMRA